MTLVQIEKRVEALERTVRDFAAGQRPVSRKWYRTEAGRFSGDPVFDKIVALGRAYRKSQRPVTESKRA